MIFSFLLKIKTQMIKIINNFQLVIFPYFKQKLNTINHKIGTPSTQNDA